MRLTALLIVVLAACGPPTDEDIARENLLRTRAVAVARAKGKCRFFVDRALAALDLKGARGSLPEQDAARQACIEDGVR